MQQQQSLSGFGMGGGLSSLGETPGIFTPGILGGGYTPGLLGQSIQTASAAMITMGISQRGERNIKRVVQSYSKY